MTDTSDRWYEHHTRRHDRRQDLRVMAGAARQAHAFSSSLRGAGSFDSGLDCLIHQGGFASTNSLHVDGAWSLGTRVRSEAVQHAFEACDAFWVGVADLKQHRRSTRNDAWGAWIERDPAGCPYGARLARFGKCGVDGDTEFGQRQPSILARTGETAVTPRVNVEVTERKPESLILPDGATVEEVVRGLRAVGATARDIISILQAIKSAGALAADLELQ